MKEYLKLLKGKADCIFTSVDFGGILRELSNGFFVCAKFLNQVHINHVRL